MKKLKTVPVEIETISPVNYYYIPAAGGMRSSDFIGDMALKYATLHQLGFLEYFKPTKFQPTYDELLNFPFWYTVAINEKMAFGAGKDTLYMKNMIRNTMQAIDYNGTNSYPGFHEGSKMYKNFYFQQPIKPGNLFYSYLLTSEDAPSLPMTLRVGNNKTGLIKLKEYTGREFMAVINAYTIQNILGKKIPEMNYDYSHHSILQYFLLGMLRKEDIVKIYET